MLLFILESKVTFYLKLLIALKSIWKQCISLIKKILTYLWVIFDDLLNNVGKSQVTWLFGARFYLDKY